VEKYVMQRRLAILLTAVALAGSTGQIRAQDAEEKHDQIRQGQAQNQQVQSPHQPDNIKITSGPTVEPQDTTAIVRWNTNKKAATIIRYGTDANDLDQKQSQKGGGARTTPLRFQTCSLEPSTTSRS
jgi:hypothetical protein